MQFSRMRPLGVTIIAILVALGGVGAIIAGLLYLGTVQMNLTVPNQPNNAKWLAEPFQI